LSNGRAQRGYGRERDLVKRLREEDWEALRAPASKGIYDVMAMKEGQRNRLYECKSTKGPYDHFGPKDRRALAEAARRAGAEAFLYWHPSRRGWTEIPASAWPSS
jgi:Holliday junction resolvase